MKKLIVLTVMFFTVACIAFASVTGDATGGRMGDASDDVSDALSIRDLEKTLLSIKGSFWEMNPGASAIFALSSPAFNLGFDLTFSLDSRFLERTSEDGNEALTNTFETNVYNDEDSSVAATIAFGLKNAPFGLTYGFSREGSYNAKKYDIASGFNIYWSPYLILGTTEIETEVLPGGITNVTSSDYGVGLENSYDQSHTLTLGLDLGSALSLYVPIAFGMEGTYEIANVQEIVTSGSNTVAYSNESLTNNRRNLYLEVEPSISLSLPANLGLDITIGGKIPFKPEMYSFYKGTNMKGVPGSVTSGLYTIEETLTEANSFDVWLALTPSVKKKIKKLTLKAKFDLEYKLSTGKEVTNKVASETLFANGVFQSSESYDRTNEKSWLNHYITLGIPVGAEYAVNDVVKLRFGAEYDFTWQRTKSEGARNNYETVHTVGGVTNTVFTSDRYQNEEVETSYSHDFTFGGGVGFDFNETFELDIAIAKSTDSDRAFNVSAQMNVHFGAKKTASVSEDTVEVEEVEEEAPLEAENAVEEETPSAEEETETPLEETTEEL